MNKVLSVCIVLLSIGLFACLLGGTALYCIAGDPIDNPRPHSCGDPIDDPRPHSCGDPIDDPIPHFRIAGDPIDDPTPHRLTI